MMHRRRFISALAVSSVSPGLLVAETLPGAVGKSIPLVRTPLVLMAPRADGVEAVWGVSRLSRGWLEWEAGAARGRAGVDAHGFVPQGHAVLRVVLRGWRAGQAGRVRAHTVAADDGEEVVSEWKTFRTLDAGAAAGRFAVWNDTHQQEATLRALHEVTPEVDFLVWNGDTCNDWRSEDLIVPTLLHPGGCDITAGRPLVLTWGNHDVRGRYAFRAPEVVGMPEGRPFGAFRAGPVGVIWLHTGEDKPDAHPGFGGRVAFDALRAEQAAWLGEVIARPEMRDAPYRVVFCHIPLRWTDETPPDYGNRGYDHFSARSRAAWHEALVAWGAQVIVSGHTHRAAWLPATTEWPYGQLIGGGPRLENTTWLEGRADERALRLTLRTLTGKVLHEVVQAPL